MGGYDPERHQRRSIRLKAYDYSLPGPYFVTICVEHRAALLGAVAGGEMVLSRAGKIIASELQRSEIRSPGVSVDAAVVMPNHLHAIIAINPVTNDAIRPVGATFMAPAPPGDQIPQYTSTPAYDAFPAWAVGIAPDSGAHPGTSRSAGIAPDSSAHPGTTRADNVATGEGVPGHQGAMNVAPTEASVRSSTRLIQGLAAGTLGEVVRGFKAASTRSVRRECDAGFAWQSNYHERVIRNDRELGVFFDYIQTNPARWSSDLFFVANEQAIPGGTER